MGIGSQAFVTLGALFGRRQRMAEGDTIISAARTDVGRVRTVNEDRVLDRADRGLWAVADGMGGLSAGDVAAGIAVATLAALEVVTEDTVRAALQAANADILATGGGRSGATIVVAQVTGRDATLFWAGDSRAYHIRGTAVRPLTRDHSVVQDLVDAGLLDDDKREQHPRANVVTRALGVAAAVEIDSVRVTLLPGDRLMLCSDGVSRSLTLRDLTVAGSPDAVADRLLAAALARDGSDNASLVVIQA